MLNPGRVISMLNGTRVGSSKIFRCGNGLVFRSANHERVGAVWVRGRRAGGRS